jgi:hypothetical protein
MRMRCSKAGPCHDQKRTLILASGSAVFASQAAPDAEFESSDHLGVMPAGSSTAANLSSSSQQNICDKGRRPQQLLDMLLLNTTVWIHH